MNCDNGHDIVMYFVAQKGKAIICLRCRKQIGTCDRDGSLLSPEKVEEMVVYSLQMRAESEALDRRMGRKR